MIEVVIADDHLLVRRGITALLAGADGIKVMGEAENGREAVELAEALEPDVLLLDITMPEMNGIEALKALGSERPPVLFLSMHGDGSLVRRTLEAGGAGYVLKRTASAELVTAIREVVAGRRFLSAALHDKLPTLAGNLTEIQQRSSHGRAN